MSDNSDASTNPNSALNMFKLGDTINVQLETIRLAASARVDEAFLREGFWGGVHRLEWLRDFIYDGYTLQIRSKFYAKAHDFNLPPVPLTWWDHFKRDAIPTFTRWLRLKVNERCEMLTAATIFPDVPQLPGGRFYYREVHPTRSMSAESE